MNLASSTALENVPTEVAIWCVLKMIATLKRQVLTCVASTLDKTSWMRMVSAPEICVDKAVCSDELETREI